jgi:hypothetical protein
MNGRGEAPRDLSADCPMVVPTAPAFHNDIRMHCRDASIAAGAGTLLFHESKQANRT